MATATQIPSEKDASLDSYQPVPPYELVFTSFVGVILRFLRIMGI